MPLYPTIWCFLLYISSCPFFHTFSAVYIFISISTMPLSCLHPPLPYQKYTIYLTSLQCLDTTTCIFYASACFFYATLSLTYSLVFIFIFICTLPLSSLRPPYLSKNVTCTNTQVSPVLPTFSPPQPFFNSETQCLKAYPCSFSNSLHCTREGVNNPKQNFL